MAISADPLRLNLIQRSAQTSRYFLRVMIGTEMGKNKIGEFDNMWLWNAGISMQFSRTALITGLI